MGKIALVGEAFGEEEERYGTPFVGKAGHQLDELLSESGINRADCFITNVFNLRPVKNQLDALCCKKNEGPTVPGLGSLVRGLYLKAEFEGELHRLSVELEREKPNVVVLLGNTACWAVLRRTAISKIRGTASYSVAPPGLKCLPTYHPANVLRQYENRHVTILDLQKAKRESEFPELRRPAREIWMEPSLDDLREFFDRYVISADIMSFDVETAARAITCIGFSPAPERAIVIPFHDLRQRDGHYWRSLEEEREAWKWVQQYLGAPCRKVAQNGMYDLQYLWMAHGIPVTNFSDDTMLLHHSLHPESPKSLGFLGSVYSNELAWKPNRPRGKELKREDEE